MVDVSMLESMLTMTLTEVQRAQFAMAPPGRPMFGPLQTRDGYLMLAVASERTFQDLARAAGRPDWIDDPRFAVYADRRLNWHLFMDELEQWSRQLTTDECQAAFERFGVPSSRYRTVEEAMADAQLAHREAFTEVRDAAGTFRTLNPPFRFSDAPAAARPFVAPSASTATRCSPRPATPRTRSTRFGRPAWSADPGFPLLWATVPTARGRSARGCPRPWSPVALVAGRPGPR